MEIYYIKSHSRKNTNNYISNYLGYDVLGIIVVVVKVTCKQYTKLYIIADASDSNILIIKLKSLPA